MRKRAHDTLQVLQCGDEKAERIKFNIVHMNIDAYHIFMKQGVQNQLEEFSIERKTKERTQKTHGGYYIRIGDSR